MRWWTVGVLCSLLSVALMTAAFAGPFVLPGTAASPVASPAAWPAACPVTPPNGNQPPPDANVFGRGAGDYGNEALWTALWIWGEGAVLVPDDERVRPDGSIREMKWAWYRYVPGKLTIEGRRLDAPAPPLEAWIPDGYGDTGFQVSGLTFPTGGCWEITGSVGDARLTFVTLVVPPPSAATPKIAGTPIAEVRLRTSSTRLPAGCSLTEVASLVTAFLDAFNRGDTTELATFFPTEVAYPDTTKPSFQWYSVTDEQGHFVAYDPADLPAYFAGRHAKGEQMRLLRLEVAESRHSGVDIVYDIERQAEDVASHVAGGKGAIMCPERTIFVWSMGNAAVLSAFSATPPPGVCPSDQPTCG